MAKDPRLGLFHYGRRLWKDYVVQVNWPALLTRVACLVAVDLIYTVCQSFQLELMGSGEDLEVWGSSDLLGMVDELSTSF